MRYKRLAWLGIVFMVFAGCARAATPTPTSLSSLTPTPRPTPTSAPQAQPKHGGSLVMAFWQPFTTWDPFLDTANLHVPVSFVYDRLFVFKTQPGCITEPEPSLAKSWKWVNDTTLEVALQPGARFANRPPVNGREITAEDVVYSFTTQVPRQPALTFLKGMLDRVEAVDKGTARFRLKVPNGSFLESAFTRFAYVVPKDAFGPEGKITEATNNLGSGPYILEKDLPAVGVEFSRNPDYWQKPLPYLDGLRIRIIPEFSTQMSLLKTGALDYLFLQAQHSLIQEAEQTLRDYNVQRCFHPQPPVLGMVNASKPFDDVRVRRAVSMAVDREGLIKSAYLGMGRVVGTAISPTYGDFFLPPEKLPPEARRYLEYSPQEAKRLLAEAGYPDGLKVRLWHTPRFGPVFTAIAEAMVGSLAQAGVKADIYSPEFPQFLQRWDSGEYDGLLLGWFYGPTLREAVFDSYHSTGRGGRAYKISASPLDTMIDQAFVTLDKEEQKRLAREFQIYAVQNPTAVALPAVVDVVVAGKWVKGVQFVPNWNTWIDSLRYAWMEK